MDFKGIAFLCIFGLSFHIIMTAPAADSQPDVGGKKGNCTNNNTYECMDASSCAGDENAIYALVGNLSLCCNEGDAMMFTAQSDKYYISSSSYYYQSPRNDGITKRSVEDPHANRTITYECICTHVDMANPVFGNISDGSGGFSNMFEQLQSHVFNKTREFMKSFMRSFSLPAF